MSDRPLSPRYHAVPAVLLAALVACQGSSPAGSTGPLDGACAPSACAPGGAGGDPGSGGDTGGDTAACNPDACTPSGAGVTWSCETRFMYGANFAWHSFAADFGGVSSWGVAGVDGNPAPFADALAQMKASGSSVIRWWMFPHLVSDGIQWGADGAPSGITPSLVADIQRALALADAADVYIMLTPFSFDNFKPTTWENGVFSRSLAPMVTDPTLRQEVMDNLLGPIADAVAQSPYRKRMIAWDVMNEPEWAITGPSVTGDPDFQGQGNLDLVTHAQMQTVLGEAANVLRQRSGSLVSVGGAAIKWPKAWSQIGLDFYQFHYYDWVYEWFPFTSVTLASAGVTDKPVVMGEFPADGLSAVPSKGLPALNASQFASALQQDGYAGALSWAFNDPAFPWDPSTVKPFADAGGCGVRY